MADAVLSAFLQVVFQELASPIIEEFGLVYGVHKQLKKLSRVLMKIRAVINDAEQRQISEEAVRIWLLDLKEVAYDADDLVDEISTQVLRSRSQVRGFFSSLNPNQFRFQFDLASKVDEVIARLEEIAKEKNDLHLREEVPRTNGNIRQGTRARLQTSSLVHEICVFGRRDDKERLVSLLLCDDGNVSKISVVPIFGMGGIGKTTLAQLVYNDSRIERHFELRMWVCVLGEFDPRRVTKSVIESAMGSRCDLLDMDPMQRRLQEVIKDKKYLLVLDDVWNESCSEWDIFRVSLNFGAEGSKILVTTRSGMVSSLVGTVPAYFLTGLSNRDCWSLFKCSAFPNLSSEPIPSLAKIGMKIVNKCQGLPLAVKDLGGLLRSARDENEWDLVLRSEIWDLPEDKIDILHSLRLSYQHLPSHLKQCFGYCSLFPRDHTYSKDKLILLWMAEGFIQPRGMKQMEDIGSDYFDELLSRSFFYYYHIDPLDGQPRYKMHGLLHDLSQFFTISDCLTVGAGKLCLTSKKVRHVSLLCDSPEAIDFETICELRKTRSLMLFGGYRHRIKKITHDLFIQLKCLRVLDVSHTSITELPSSIGNLKHLRYLDVSWTFIRSLPESLCGLCNLQTLKLIKCLQLEALPENMSCLINLRHLNVSFGTVLLKILPFANRRLLDLPSCIKNLINLRDIETSLGTSYQNILPFVERESCLNLLARMISTPPGIGNLTCLQTLSNFVVTKRTGCGVEELKNMINLRGSLCIAKLENVTHRSKAREANLKSKHRLYELTLQWSEESLFSTRNELLAEEVIGCLEPHRNIKDLRIANFCGRRLPSWMEPHSLINTVCICLFNCQKCETLPPLWNLPSLKVLRIHGIHGLKCIGPEFYGRGNVAGIPSLQMLEVKDIPNLVEWSGVAEGQTPSLCELTIWDCPKMSRLPNLPSSLMTLEVANCKKLGSFSTLNSIKNLVLGQCDEVMLNSPPCLTSLQSLTISSFSKMVFLPDSLLECLASLKVLKVIDCDNLGFLTEEQSLWKLGTLECLEICSCPQLKTMKEELLPTTLKSFRLVSCPCLTALPEEMQPLSALQFLEVWDCPQLVSLPERPMPASLQLFWVRTCPCLKERCREEGEDWPKISHVPNIRIDLEWVQQN